MTSKETQSTSFAIVHEIPASTVMVTSPVVPSMPVATSLVSSVASYPVCVTVWTLPSITTCPTRVSVDIFLDTTYTHETPASPDVRGLIEIQSESVEAVQVPLPEVNTVAAPPVFVNVLAIGSIVMAAKALQIETTIAVAIKHFALIINTSLPIIILRRFFPKHAPCRQRQIELLNEFA